MTTENAMPSDDSAETVKTEQTEHTPLPDEVVAFQRTVGFALDDFQVQAARSIVYGRGVLVAAPTGAGKTIVADFAVYLTMESAADEKIFYTTPIKALSNQKFHELQERYGESNVGLLTGDNNINATAPIVVMTTEVLRNMIYERSDLLGSLSFVVMDEVHYLADRMRGPVWEEVIIQLPEHVRLISLSATVSNAEEFGAWLQEVRGHTDVIVSEFRPVPLSQHVLVRGDLDDLFEPGRPGQLNRHLHRLSGLDGPRSNRERRRGGHHRQQRVDRAALVKTLERADLLPMIGFIFSRVGCDAAVRQCMLAGISLTTKQERDQIKRIIDRHCRDIPYQDREVLGFKHWKGALLRGVGAHHAGLLPAFKETVEELYQRRLVRAVFATETLALGINMPARTVVIESLEKYNGVARVPITAGEYTQLTGRAGRRGIDDQGHSVVVWQPGVDLERVASLASRRTYPLKSAFRPTYNMAVNLIGQFGLSATREILESSFAQFQADRSVVGLARKLKEQRTSLDGYAEAAGLDDPLLRDFFDLRHELSETDRSIQHISKKERRSGSRREDLIAHARDLKAQLRQHPAARIDDVEDRARWAERWWRLQRQTEDLQREIEHRVSNIALTFERVVRVLVHFGYLSADADLAEVAVTDQAGLLDKIYGERDLVVAECLRREVWKGLEPDQLAAIVTALVYEPRRDRGDEEVWLPRGALQKAYADTLSVWHEIDDQEQRRDLPRFPEPNALVCTAVLRWSRGATLDHVLEEAELPAGDFVRLMKMVIDLLDQIGAAQPDGVGAVARSAKDLLLRGIVEYSSVG
ncbi:DEAD/DEAH box helicase [Pseudoclavibacter sp. CFCC 13611]|uniref:DEAD/DEAH box helicase n=1 Tax=Pseudoclavibacter sp. CFCC 13611 TaxID=2615178 RepID=UPI001CE44293|nr:DEAD/DEAH box helicase [Pseudoclavibacter sp. CFCC 13611]